MRRGGCFFWQRLPFFWQGLKGLGVGSLQGFAATILSRSRPFSMHPVQPSTLPQTLPNPTPKPLKTPFTPPPPKQEFHPYVFQIFAQLIELRAPPLPGVYLQIFPPLLSPAFWERPGNVPALVRLLQARPGGAGGAGLLQGGGAERC